MPTTDSRIRVRTVAYCAAHYPLLLDGQAVLCTLEPGHEGDHQEVGPFGDVRAFEDQPSCWDSVPEPKRPEQKSDLDSYDWATYKAEEIATRFGTQVDPRPIIADALRAAHARGAAGL